MKRETVRAPRPQRRRHLYQGPFSTADASVPKNGVFLVVDTAMRQHGLPSASGNRYAHEVARPIMVWFHTTVNLQTPGISVL
jgi:hypothetical protein